jgi:8-oxo-dGTP pyrophosphatase MutT (NUDIX family)
MHMSAPKHTSDAMRGEETCLYSGPWLAVIDRGGYVFAHTQNSAVYLLPFRRPCEAAYLLARLEVCPAHGAESHLYAITGQCPPGEAPLAIAIQELYEEAGFQAEATRFEALGSVYLSKQTDTVAHLFAVDITGLPPFAAPTDGSRFEEGSACAWVTREEALGASCAGLLALIAKSRL